MKALVLPLFALAFTVLWASPAFALGVGDSAPCVELNDIQASGTVVDECITGREPGRNFALLEFFATTCSDCAENLPKLSALAADIHATTTTRLVGIDRDANATEQYVSANHDLIQFATAVDNDRTATQAFGVTVTPTVFIVDKNSTIVYVHEGVFTDADIAQIEGLVK